MNHTILMCVCVCILRHLHVFNHCFSSLFSDMLQLISNQEMEFGTLFDNPPYSGLTPTPELTGLAQPITLPAAPKPKVTPPSTSSIVSSTPHLDALLGPPITRSSSTPDKTFQSTTFQQSPLAQVSSPTLRQKPASAQQNPSVRPTMIEQPQPSLSPSPPAQAQSPSHGSPGPNLSFTANPQALFTSPAPQSPPQTQLQTQIQTQPQPIQARTNHSSQNSFTGERIFKVSLFKCDRAGAAWNRMLYFPLKSEVLQSRLSLRLVL